MIFSFSFFDYTDLAAKDVPWASWQPLKPHEARAVTATQGAFEAPHGMSIVRTRFFPPFLTKLARKRSERDILKCPSCERDG